MTTIQFTLPRPPTPAEQALIESWWAERGHDVTITLLSPADDALAKRATASGTGMNGGTRKGATL